eukprot:scaffold312799_cov30-Tisochrysis_lutea.AAC.2
MRSARRVCCSSSYSRCSHSLSSARVFMLPSSTWSALSVSLHCHSRSSFAERTGCCVSCVSKSLSEPKSEVRNKSADSSLPAPASNALAASCTPLSLRSAAASLADPDGAGCRTSVRTARLGLYAAG